MVASEEQIQAAAEAMALGEALAREHWQAAAENPGLGWQVRLPSAPDSAGQLPQGEGFNLPDGTPALQSPTRPRLIPDYGPPPVGGAGYHTTEPGSASPFDGVRWPSPGSSPSRSSVVHISPRPRGTGPNRVRTAVRTSQTSAPISPGGPGATSRRGRLRRALGMLLGKQ